MNEDREGRAWRWLLKAIPRVEWKHVSKQSRDQQIRVTAKPGHLYKNQGAPYVRVSVVYPGHLDRMVGTGNSLAEAVHNLVSELWRRGIEIRGPEFPEDAWGSVFTSPEEAISAEPTETATTA